MALVRLRVAKGFGGLLPCVAALTWIATVVGTAAGGEEWRTFTNLEGRKVEARVLMVLDEEARVILKKSGREVGLRLDTLSEEDRAYLDAWEEPRAADSDGDLGEAKSRLYPRTKDEIRRAIQEISNREPINGVSKEQQKVINELNIYRYLCGVPYDVVATPGLVAKAAAAAAACQRQGKMSHSLGHNTNKCNLTSGGGMFRSVVIYIGDGGSGNRAKRLHRRWCLNGPMKRAAFGESGRYSAMWCMDSSGQKPREGWSYPGRGFFPKARIHGNGWSFYLRGKAPGASQLKVEVFKIAYRPERAFGMTEDIIGEALPVEYVSTAYNAINFEPDSRPLGSGIYWVRIRGRSVRVGYVVELY